MGDFFDIIIPEEITQGVINMEELQNDIQVEEEKYVPRPAWQVWAARIGLVVFILGVIAYYLNVFRGGF